MIVSLDKFRAIVLQQGNKSSNTTNALNTEKIAINPSKSMKLLRITIGNKLNFEDHISVLQKQPSRGVLRKRCSENMQQIYRRTPMPKCDFNKVALHIYN